MNYTEKQIEAAKKNYNAFLQMQTVTEGDVITMGYNEALRRVEDHNRIVSAILAGDKALEREWKTFFLSEEVKKDRKEAASKAKLAANKEASSDVLAPIKAIKKMGEFGKWLNTSGNPFRKQHFNKVYTAEAVETFLQTIQ